MFKHVRPSIMYSALKSIKTPGLIVVIGVYLGEAFIREIQYVYACMCICVKCVWIHVCMCICITHVCMSLCVLRMCMCNYNVIYIATYFISIYTFIDYYRRMY